MWPHRLHAIPAFLLIALCALAADRPQPLLIEAGRLLDVRTGAYIEHPGILTEGDRIKDVGDFAKVRERAPNNALAIDLRNATVLPGLIDCHAHLLAAMEFRHLSDALTVMLSQMSPSTRALLGARNAREDLEAGVTTVRIVGHSGINGDAA